VEVESEDTGCDQYADWWEVVDQNGSLLYRRILMHSHVNEQPFSRSGGPVETPEYATLIIRVHMHPHGYSRSALKGSVKDGFQPVLLDQGFAESLAEVPPLPDTCAF
jgi:hypothetical protein